MYSKGWKRVSSKVVNFLCTLIIKWSNRVCSSKFIPIMKVPFCLLMTSLFVSIRTEENNVNGSKFAIENGKRVVASTYNTEFATTKVMCAMMCISEAKCCEASYNNATYICRLDTSENCCVTMENFDGWEVIKKKNMVIYVLVN